MKVIAVVAAASFVCVAAIYRSEIVYYAQRLPIINRFFRPTVESKIAAYGAAARTRWAPKFEAAKLTYPPSKIEFVAIKDKRELEVYAANGDGALKYVDTYPILGASGHLGPKLREGDRQVPEGIYQLTLEPNTPYHVALRLNYPNATDLERARADHRANPGSDILIHGTSGSVGCLAMGDEGSEDLFVLAYDTHQNNLPLIIAPVDLRAHSAPVLQPSAPKWLPQLYIEIKNAMKDLSQ